MLRLLTPDLRVKNVLELDVSRLRDLGLESLLLDVDCTLKRYGEPFVPAAARSWLDDLRAAGIGVCLVSNGRPPRIGRVAEPLNLPFVCKALKPLPFRCRRAIRRMAFNPQRTAMVGDQIFADVMAGRLAGVRTILVCPIDPDEEPWFTRMKRPFERWVLRRLEKAERKTHEG